MQRLRIAQVAPLYESVPPQLYGGTERVVSYLTEELVRQGHEVTLFASGDSATAARLVPCAPRALRLDPQQHRLPGPPRGDAGAGLPAGRGLRPHPLPRRLPPLPAQPPAAHPPGHDPARTAGPARPGAPLPGVPRDARGLHLGGPARPAPLARLAGDGLPRPPHGAPRLPARARGLPRLPRPHLARKAARPRHRDRPAGGHAPAHRGQGGPRRPRLLRGGGRAAPGPAARRVRGRDRRGGEDGSSWAAPRPCSSPSTGRSRSAW